MLAINIHDLARYGAAVAVVVGLAGCGPTVAARATTRACSVDQLAFAVAPQADSLSGEHDDLIVVTNHGSADCRVLGYPRVSLQDRNRPLAFGYSHRSQYITVRAPHLVRLAPGRSAYFLVAKYRCDGPTATTAETMRVWLPGVNGSGLVTLDRSGVHQLDYCGRSAADTRIDPGNRVTISPVQATAKAALS